PSKESVPSRSRIRARHASTSSRDEASRRATAAAASSTPRSARSVTARSSHEDRACYTPLLMAASRIVRDEVFDLFRRRGLTTMFANPGSTEVPFLAGMPDDVRFVLGLHEGSVVGMASGYAIGRGEPSLVLLHTTAGLGTAVSALATARVNRAPLV